MNFIGSSISSLFSYVSSYRTGQPQNRNTVPRVVPLIQLIAPLDTKSPSIIEKAKKIESEIDGVGVKVEAIRKKFVHQFRDISELNLIPNYSGIDFEILPVLEELRNNNEILDHLIFSTNPIHIRKFKYNVKTFYYYVDSIERNFSNIDLNTFTVKQLFLFLACDGLTSHKEKIAVHLKNRILEMNRGKFPLNDFAETLPPSIHFFRSIELNLILNNCPNLSADELLKLYSYEHPALLVERNIEETIIYEIFQNYKDSFLKWWMKLSKDFTAAYRIGRICNVVEKTNQMENKLSDRLESFSQQPERAYNTESFMLNFKNGNKNFF